MASSMRFPMLTIGVVGLALSGCISPTDKSDSLTIQFAPIPSVMLEGDSVALSARVLDEDGVEVPNSHVELTTSPDLVARVLAGDVLVAVDTGTVTVTARAVEFAETPVAQQSVTVRALLAVDSVLPDRALRYGERLELFGIGLDPAGLFGVSLGGVTLPFAGYEAADTTAPDRFGRLELWIPPPAQTAQGLAILGAKGGLVIQRSIAVDPRDVLEPNDTAARHLGTLSGGVSNPALAFEPRFQRDPRPAVDWYSFTTTTTSDWTIEVDGRDLGRPIGVFVSDSVYWSGEFWGVDPDTFNPETGLGWAIYALPENSWMVGADANICRGLLINDSFSPFQLGQRATARIALGALPAGTYHIVVSYLGDPFTFYDSFIPRTELDLFVDADIARELALGDPAKSVVRVVPEYVSALPPDGSEGNDFCDQAPTIALSGSVQYTFDNPFDVDWFKFTMTADQAVQFSVVSADSASDPDIYVIRDFGTSLVLWDAGLDFGSEDQTFGFVLDAGDYFLVLADFTGIPTTYQLTAEVLPAPPLNAAGLRATWQDQEADKRERAGHRPATVRARRR
ncbi:MAG TPA: pre-peptidase C-terminal domain-containing protein [Gemmatimonadales bacterium]